MSHVSRRWLWATIAMLVALSCVQEYTIHRMWNLLSPQIMVIETPKPQHRGIDL